jgi:hypothetical protein
VVLKIVLDGVFRNIKEDDLAISSPMADIYLDFLGAADLLCIGSNTKEKSRDQDGVELY